MLARRLTQSRSRSRTCAALRGFSPAASSLPCLLNWTPVAEPVNCADLCDLTVTFFCQLYCLLCDSFQVILSEAAWVNLGFVYPDKEIFVPLIRTWNLKVFVLLCMRKSRIGYLLLREEYECEFGYPKWIKLDCILETSTEMKSANDT